MGLKMTRKSRKGMTVISIMALAMMIILFIGFAYYLIFESGLLGNFNDPFSDFTRDEKPFKYSSGGEIISNPLIVVYDVTFSGKDLNFYYNTNLYEGKPRGWEWWSSYAAEESKSKAEWTSVRHRGGWVFKHLTKGDQEFVARMHGLSAEESGVNAWTLSPEKGLFEILDTAYQTDQKLEISIGKEDPKTKITIKKSEMSDIDGLVIRINQVIKRNE